MALSCAARAVRPTEVGENAYTQYQAVREPNPCDLPNERPSAARQEREAFLQSQGAKESVSSLLSNQNNQSREPAAKWVPLSASNCMCLPTQARRPHFLYLQLLQMLKTGRRARLSSRECVGEIQWLPLGVGH